ncbi:MAG TPA: MFS transporter, partial [Gaiellaceae bacterium]
MKGGTPRSRTLWTFAVTSLALVVVTLDNLVVTTALPVIRKDLGAGIESLEWTVNAYTLTFAVLLLTGAALGDRFGRRRMFSIGLVIFTLASAAAALAPSIDALVAARALQGVGGAIITPLTLTILSSAVPAEKRGVALGAWGGIGGLAVALGPLVGGAVVSGLSWQWIFWINVPLGVVLIPLALRRLDETHGPSGRLDLPGLGLASVGLFGIVWGLVRGNGQGWAGPEIVGSLTAGAALVVAFVLWELRTETPMLPMRFFRIRTFTMTNIASLLMFFGMFGSIFLLVSSLLPYRTTPRSSPGCACCRGRRCRSSSRRSRARCRIGSAVGGSWQPVCCCRRAASPGSRPFRRRPSRIAISSCRSFCPAPAWRSFSRRWRTSSSRRCGRRRRARPPGPTTRSASSGACS